MKISGKKAGSGALDVDSAGRVSVRGDWHYDVLLRKLAPAPSQQMATLEQTIPDDCKVTECYDLVRQVLQELSIADKFPKFEQNEVSDSTIAVAL